MDCVSPILDVATRLWDCTSKRAVYVRELEGNLKTLKSTMEELNNKSKDVMGRVEGEEELQQSRRTHEVDGWLNAVKAIREEVEDILQKGNQEIQKKCLGICRKNCWSSYKFGKIVSDKIDAVTELMGKGRFDVVTQRLPRAPVEERPMGKTVGLDLMFEKVQKCLEDQQVRSVGLYGMGGVGKTTLLQKINNEFFGKRSDFHVVIWIVVSRPINIEKIQEGILKRLRVKDDTSSSSKEEKAAKISTLLKEKVFVIFLDDVWERLNLLEVGIPPLNDHTKSKVVLTTRSEEVCDVMGVHRKFKVECLTTEEAFSLFCDNVGENIINSHPDIKRLAKIVVAKCQGLPLALIVIGRSMASRRTPREWEQAIEVLESYPAEFSGVGDEVFPILKFSYDHLNNITKSCLLYCSLFPEDYDFEEEEIINLWIGEQLISKYDDMYDARNQGYEIIRNLKLACLLESGKREDSCKMHDMIHGMARWLSCNHGKERQKILVLENVEAIEAFEVVRWEKAQRILLWDSNFKENFYVPPRFPNLQTFIVRDSGMKSLPIGLFQFMPIIRVLELTGNQDLEELPFEICRLESLEYLNLTSTGIKKIPEELKNLKKLRCLILDDMSELEAIPPNVISCLSHLQMFSIIWGFNEDIKGYEECLLELERLQFLSEININLCTSSSVKKLLSSPKLQKRIRHLCIYHCQGLNLLELSVSTLQRLRLVEFSYCFDLECVKIIKQSEDKQGSMPRPHISNSYFSDLVKVLINSGKFVDLTWITYVPGLEYFSVCSCDKLEEIIAVDECRESEIEEKYTSIFSRLKELKLRWLPNLKSICRRPLPFPSLSMIYVVGCPNLRKLPLNSNSVTNTSKIIMGEPSWWKGLEWESDHLKTTFAPYFQSWY